MDVSVVITCWNGRKLLEKNFPSVVDASKNPKNKIKEVIVVDDASKDDSVEFLKTNFPKVKIVQHLKNLGYSSACNTGVKAATGELVVILNTDVIPSKDFLETVLPSFNDEKVFAVSFNEGKFGPGKLEWKNGFLEIVPSESCHETTVTDWASGGSSIFRKSHWEKLGGMDKLFLPFYFEDVDLGIRARKAGFKCLWEPSAKVEHVHESSINPENFKQKYIDSIKQRNQLLLTWKHIGDIRHLSLHVFYLGLRCFSHPGYCRMLLLSLKRRFLNI